VNIQERTYLMSLNMKGRTERMIENEELGLKIAESSSEELWIRFLEVTKENIKKAENDLELYNEFLKLAESKVKK
jgi:hypothetical protein